MKKYRVNIQTSENSNQHEIHQEACEYYLKLTSYEELNYHTSCKAAILNARGRGYKKVNGCKDCCPECYKG